MDSERWQKLERLFFEAAARDANARDQFLVEACAGDQELLIELRSMLDVTDEEPLLGIESRLRRPRRTR